jgi:hypothetical protein
LKSSQWKEKCNDVIVAAAVRMRVLDRLARINLTNSRTSYLY